MKTVYQEATLESVLNVFAKSYEVHTGQVLYAYETFVDVRTGRVLFKLSVLEPGEAPDPNLTSS